MRRLEEMLARVSMSDMELRRIISGGDDMQLLDLACGACNEAKTLPRFFSGLQKGAFYNQKLKFVGLDLRAREIAEAAARFGDDPKADFEFLQGNATQLQQHRQLPDEFNVIFVRHQRTCGMASAHGKKYTTTP